jgi:tetratricopeptide (TPR) repeat protein
MFEYKNLDFSKRHKLVETLEKDVASMMLQIEKTKAASLRVPSNKRKFDGFLVASNMVRGVLNGLSESTISKSEASKNLKEAYAKAKAAHAITISAHVENNAAAAANNNGDDIDIEIDDGTEYTEVEDRESGVDSYNKDDVKLANQISNLKLYRKNLPSKIKGTYSVAHLPIIPIFKNIKLSNPSVLKSAGFKTIHFSGDDLEGYVVIDKQAILLIDYDKYNKEFLKASEEEYEAEMEAYKEDFAEWKSKLAAHEEALEQHEQALEEMDEYYEEKKVYDEYLKKVANRNKLREKFEAEMELYKEGKLKTKPVPPPRIAEVKKPVKPKDPGTFESEFLVPRPKRPLKPTDFDSSDFIEVVSSLLEELNEELNVDYVLVAETHKRNPKNPNLLCFWIAEKWKIKNLERKVGRVNVADWGFTF